MRFFKVSKENSSMNRNQWFVFGGVMFLMFLFFIWDATLQAHNANMIMAVRSYNMSVVDSNLYNALTIRSSIYGSFGTICFGLFFIFLICGYLEKKK